MQTNLKLYIIPALIFVFLFILVLILPFGNNKTSTTAKPTVFATPTLIPGSQDQTQNIPSHLITPKFTGVFDEELPQEVQSLSKEKQELRKITPLQLDGCLIDFDYEQDKFAVTVDEPKEENRTKCESWITATYPSLPLDRFLFQ